MLNNTEDMKENALIAKFMGISEDKDIPTYSNWDEIIPVVIKIEKIRGEENEFNIFGNCVELADESFIGKTKLQAVIKAINWWMKENLTKTNKDRYQIVSPYRVLSIEDVKNFEWEVIHCFNINEEIQVISLLKEYNIKYKQGWTNKENLEECFFVFNDCLPTYNDIIKAREIFRLNRCK